MNGNDRMATTLSADEAAARFQKVKAIVHQRLIDVLDLAEAQRMSPEQLRSECTRRVDRLLTEQGCPLSAPEKQGLN